MKRLYFSLLFFIYGIFSLQAQSQSPPPPGPAPDIQVGQATSFQLKNGLKVFVVENHRLPVVSMSLVLDNDPIAQGDKTGYVDMAGAMMRTGTKTRSKEKTRRRNWLHRRQPEPIGQWFFGLVAEETPEQINRTGCRRGAEPEL